MWEISKSFDFCYGHRVHNQKLNPDFSIDSCLACRHLHGHQGKVIITLASSVLIDGMVTDFKHLNWFKKWLDDVLDHKFIIDKDDPLLKVLFPKVVIPSGVFENSTYFLPFGENYQYDNNAERELYEGLVIVPFVPTSENLSEWLFEIVDKKMMQIGVHVKSVQFYETPKSMSSYVA